MGSGSSQDSPKRFPRKVTIDHEAEAEIIEAALWYASQRAGLEDLLLLALDAALECIARHPLRYVIVDEPIRRVLLERFPYGVFYVVRRYDVLVLAFHHSARDPQRWIERRKGTT